MPAAAPDFPLETFTLDNGLRVVVNPDHSSPAVAVGMFYDVGFRSEPEGRSGFAHLFEHMMFQGSANVGKWEFPQLIQGNGGSFNGTTTPDYTNYFEIVPSRAFELALFLEADRMRSLAVTQENLDNQIAVVKEEIRVNVLNRPYGGFPWIDLGSVMFDTFANSHNGYGSFVDLEAATIDDVADFFATFYTPANAVLAIVGDVTAEVARDLIERHFAPIRGKRAPQRRTFSEALPRRERRAAKTDTHAPTPAFVAGYRAPDPVEDLDEILALDILGRILTDGEASRLQRRLIRDAGIATAVDAWVGVFSDPLGMRDPTRFQILVHHGRSAEFDELVDVIDDEIASAVVEVTADEVERMVAAWQSSYLRGVDGFLRRVLVLGPMELIHRRPHLINDLPDRIAAVSPAAVEGAAASWLRPELRTLLRLDPVR